MPAGTTYALIRSTVDSWEVQGQYEHGWECVTAEETRKEARERLKEYRANESAPFRLVLKREKVQS
jgi:DNA polymerase IIIc chi subunit